MTTTSCLVRGLAAVGLTGVLSLGLAPAASAAPAPPDPLGGYTTVVNRTDQPIVVRISKTATAYGRAIVVTNLSGQDLVFALDRPHRIGRR